MRSLFERYGEVKDLFVSTKIRKSTNFNFGFVRYGSLQEAKMAISELDGFAVRNLNLRVSMARYEIGGAPVRGDSQTPQQPPMKNRKITYPANRDNRRYSEVVAGVKNKQQPSEAKMKEENSGIIPISHSVKVSENSDMAELLHKAIIAENTELLDLYQTQTSVSACDINQTGIFSLSLTKVLIVFNCEDDAQKAVNCDSPLWNIFDDIRMWSEGEFFDDRLVWIKCVGIHPLGWPMDNLKSIGELWGPVIHVDTKSQGMENITGARILIRTKAQNKIDNRIKLFYDNGSCDVWVKEQYSCCGVSCVSRKDYMSKPTPKHVVEKDQRTLDDPTHTRCDYDPLLQEMNNWCKGEESRLWVDPMAVDENIGWIKVGSTAICSPPQIVSSPVSTPIKEKSSSRPRGRPRKYVDQGITEARKTWKIAQRLGISADDEDAVLSGLRKSKRIGLMEGKEA